MFIGKALTAIWCFVNDYGSTKIFGRIFNQNRVCPAGLPQKKEQSVEFTQGQLG
jgi:hypothetical protein